MKLDESTFLSALHADPSDHVAWLALADWLEDDGQTDRAELLRLRSHLIALGEHMPPSRRELEQRMADLLCLGVRPAVAEITNSIGMRFVLISPGRFLMGTSENDNGRLREETPPHAVELTRAFYVGVFPVTQAEYEAVTGKNPSAFRGATRPVECVSWLEAGEYCDGLSSLPAEQRAGRIYRLPSEAEWEYACRAGGSTRYIHDESWNGQGNVRSQGTTPVGGHVPNAWGLYDLLGNVWEWCADSFDPRYYSSCPERDPLKATNATSKSIRGGAWFGEYHTTVRQGWSEGFLYRDLGFRVVCEWRPRECA